MYSVDRSDDVVVVRSCAYGCTAVLPLLLYFIDATSSVEIMLGVCHFALIIWHILFASQQSNIVWISCLFPSCDLRHQDNGNYDEP